MIISASDGRALEVEVDGPSDGRPLIFHVGTPSTGKLHAPMLEAGAARGIRHVVYSRPGYGGSARAPGRTVADCAGDIVAVADALGIDRFFTAGWSGGGPHALACAALLPERVIAAATIAGVAPRDAEGLDWFAGMGGENLEEYAAADAGEDPLRACLERFASELAYATGPGVREALGDLVSEADANVLTGEFADYLADRLRAALEQGIWGWLDDDLAFVRDWGFDLGAISMPVSIWHGGQDRFVPYSHGEWLAGHVAGASPHLHPEHGHLSLAVGAYPAVLDDLIARA